MENQVETNGSPSARSSTEPSTRAQAEGVHSKSSGQQSRQAVIVEIRAGTGGDEAGLFARDLYRMYSKYAASQGWSQKVLDSNQSDIGGFKEIIFEFQGPRAYEQMQYEGGVHRVQRIPKTEKQGRVHTLSLIHI